MSIVFYYAPMSSATPVAWALTELGVSHEKVRFDLAKREQKNPEFLKLNPNGKVPTLVVDGTPMFEAVAIMQWLGDRFGVDKKLWPKFDDPARLQAISWATWSYVSFGSAMSRLFMATSDQLPPEFKSAAQAEHCRAEMKELLSILDQRVSAKPYLLSEQFSLADLIVASVVGWGTMNKISLEQHAQARAWLERCQSRPSFKASWAV